MGGLQITIGAATGTNWMALIVPGAIAGLSTLLGIGLTNWSLAKHRKADREHETAERNHVEGAREQDRLAQESRQRALTSLKFAGHLEIYALACAKRIDEINTINWGFDGEDVTHIPGLPDFPAWPVEIDWRVLGAELAAWGQNFEMRVELMATGLASTWEHGDDPEDYATDAADESSLLGIDAWEKAADFRQNEKLVPVAFEGRAWKFPEFLRKRAEKVVKKREEHAALLAKLTGKQTPNEL